MKLRTCRNILSHTVTTLKAILFVSLTFLLITSQRVFAEDQQFKIDYNISYTVDERGETSVEQQANITNLRNDVIPTNYTFSAKQLKIYEVKAETNGKYTVPKVETKEDETFVSVTIANYSIGEGQQNKIKIIYKTKDIASKSGEIWNVYIPKIQIPDSTVLYNVKLSIPESFGKKIYLSPTPVIEDKQNNSNIYYFTKESFSLSGIIGAFGDYQPLNFKLKYHLKNLIFLPEIKEIALPPDIKEMQSVSYNTINPKPLKIRQDTDGNFIAYYIVAPFRDLNIEVTGTAKIYGKQINPDLGGNFEELPKDMIRKYTKKQKYWETDSPYIQKLANDLKDKNINVAKNAQKIYTFISNNLTYNFDALNKGLVERQGAEKALIQKGSWTCMEFTDLFIATARSMGIPAREINGYAFTFEERGKPISINLRSGDLLHSWAEFYDPFYGWVQIDPTWGTTSGIDYFTKLDNNHFAFVIKGKSSEYPYPAGTYRLTDDEKLIDVAVAQNIYDENFKPKIEVKKALNLNPVMLIKGMKKISIKNTGGVFVYNLNGKNIPVGGSLNVYLDKNDKEIEFQDVNGNNYNYILNF